MTTSTELSQLRQAILDAQAEQERGPAAVFHAVTAGSTWGAVRTGKASFHLEPITGPGVALEPFATLALAEAFALNWNRTIGAAQRTAGATLYPVLRRMLLARIVANTTHTLDALKGRK